MAVNIVQRILQRNVPPVRCYLNLPVNSSEPVRLLVQGSAAPFHVFYKPKRFQTYFFRGRGQLWDRGGVHTDNLSTHLVFIVTIIKFTEECMTVLSLPTQTEDIGNSNRTRVTEFPQ